MPEPSFRKAAQRLHTYTYNLRQVCTRVAGDNTYVRLKRRWYSLNAQAFDVDLWNMRDAAAVASTAVDNAARVAALRRVVCAYTGPLADGSGYLWVASYRDAVRREYVAAVVAAGGAAVLGWVAGMCTFKRSRRWCPSCGRTLICAACRNSGREQAGPS